MNNQLLTVSIVGGVISAAAIIGIPLFFLGRNSQENPERFALVKNIRPRSASNNNDYNYGEVVDISEHPNFKRVSPGEVNSPSLGPFGRIGQLPVIAVSRTRKARGSRKSRKHH